MKPLYYLDTETKEFEPGDMAPPIICLQLAVDENQPSIFTRTDFNLENVFKALFDDIEHSNGLIVAHNAEYDFNCITEQYPSLLQQVIRLYDNNQIVCTKYRAYLIDLADGKYIDDRKKMPYSLAALAKRYCSIDMHKESVDTQGIRTTFGALFSTPLAEWSPAYIEYALLDVVALRAVYKYQEQQAPEKLVDQFNQSRYYMALKDMSNYGCHTDVNQVVNLKKRSLENMSKLQNTMQLNGYLKPKLKRVDNKALVDKETIIAVLEKIYRTSNTAIPRTKSGAVSISQKMLIDTYPLDPVIMQELITAAGYQIEGWSQNKKAVQDDILKAYEHDTSVEIYNYDDDGNITSIKTDKDTIEQSGSERLAVIPEYNSEQNIISTYLPVFEEGIGKPIHSNYGFAATGRTTSYKPNLQNQQRKAGLREVFIPREGYVFCAVDYDAAELVSLAQACKSIFGWSVMADCINRGMDLHCYTASKIKGMDYDEFYALYKSKDKEAKNLRSLAKVPNFGYPGGMGPRKLIQFARASYGIHITLEQAKDLKRIWFEAFPEMKLWLESAGSAVKQGFGTATQLMSNRLRGGLTYCNYANTRFQGLTADYAKRAVWELYKACNTPGHILYGCQLIFFIHDEIIMQIPDDERLTERADEMTRIMLEVNKMFTPDVMPGASPTLMRRWSKSAYSVRDENGQLSVWELEELSSVTDSVACTDT